jgi:hypothetical protein
MSLFFSCLFFFFFSGKLVAKYLKMMIKMQQQRFMMMRQGGMGGMGGMGGGTMGNFGGAPQMMMPFPAPPMGTPGQAPIHHIINPAFNMGGMGSPVNVMHYHMGVPSMGMGMGMPMMGAF